MRRNRDDRNRLIIDGSTELAKVVVIKASIDDNEPLLLTYARRAALVRNVSESKRTDTRMKECLTDEKSTKSAPRLPRLWSEPGADPSGGAPITQV